MKTPSGQIALALSMYYEGMSLSTVRKYLEKMHHIYPSDSTVYEWITRFSKAAIRKTNNYQPVVGDEWIADETTLMVGSNEIWLWDMICSSTRFLLATHIAKTRTTADSRILMEKATERSGKIPNVIITDKLEPFLDGTELKFGASTKHIIKSKEFTVQQNPGLVERFHYSLNNRTKVMQGLKKLDTAKLVIDAWLVYYNFLRPQGSLSDRTPAETAGIKFPFKNWKAKLPKTKV